MQISLFQPTKTAKGFKPGVKPTEQMSYQSYFDDIQSGKWQDLVLSIRTAKDKKELKKLKLSAPGVTPSGTFSYRSTKHLLHHSGVIALDFDAKDNEYFPADEIATNPYVFALHRSISGKGWVVYVKINEDKHLDSFLALEKYFADEYHVILDKGCKDICRFRFISFDPGLHHNPSSRIWRRFLPKKTIMPRNTYYVHTDNDIEHCINQINSQRLNIAEDYSDWIKIGMALASEMGENGRSYFHDISSLSSKYDKDKCDKKYDNLVKTSSGRVKIATFFWICKLAGLSIKTKRTAHIEKVAKMRRRLVGQPGGHNTIKEAEETSIRILTEIDGVEGPDVKKVIDQVMELPPSALKLSEGDELIGTIKEFLRTYDLKFNQVTRHIETDGDDLTDRDVNSMYIKALEVLTPPEQKGKSISKELLTSIIESDFVPDYHPLKEWFQQRSNLQPTGIIEQLFKCVKVKDFKSDEHHVKGSDYLLKYGRKWLLSCVASWHGTYSVMMLVFTGDQNLGKTKFFRGLMPEELKHYYAESSLDQGKDSEILMCKKAMICDDEFEGMDKNAYKRVKSLLSKQIFAIRKPFGRISEDLPRYAVLCGTGNEDEVINDPTGNRRIIPVPVIDIDWKSYAAIDKEALWMEIYHEWKLAGEDWMLSKGEVHALNKLTQSHEQTRIEEELLKQYFAVPEKGDMIDYMTNTEIRNYLENRTAKMKVSSKLLGLFLKKLGFVQQSKKINGHTKRVYSVVKIENDL